MGYLEKMADEELDPVKQQEINSFVNNVKSIFSKKLDGGNFENLTSMPEFNHLVLLHRQARTEFEKQNGI